MIDPQAKPGPYVRLLALVAVLGLMSALVTFVFMALVNVGTGAIWEQAAAALGMDTRLFTVLVCTLGGLLVGLLVKLFGDHNAIFAELMLEFGKTGRFDHRHAPGIVITAFVSLIAGGSLGPEAPLADATVWCLPWAVPRAGIWVVLVRNYAQPSGKSDRLTRVGDQKPCSRNWRMASVFRD